MKHKRNNFFFHLFRTFIIIPTLGLLYRFECRGAENLPETGPAVLVSKHQSWIDLFGICEAVYRNRKRQMNYIAKVELFGNIFGDFKGSILEAMGRVLIPFTTTGLRWMGAVPLDRENPEKKISSFKFIRSMLSQDEFVVIYPEGKVYPGEMGPFKQGFIELMIKMQRKLPRPVAFIPVGMSYGGKKGAPRKMIVNIGEPLYFKDPGGDPADLLRCRIRELTDFDI